MERHGWYSIDRHDRIMVVRMFDAWNTETIRDYVDAAARAMPTGRAGAWATVTDLRQWGLAGMEMMAPIRDQIADHTRRGRTHAVFLLSHQQDLLTALIQQALGEGQPGVQTTLETDDTGAADWLGDHGFDVTAYRRAVDGESG